MPLGIVREVGDPDRVGHVADRHQTLDQPIGFLAHVAGKLCQSLVSRPGGNEAWRRRDGRAAAVDKRGVMARLADTMDHPRADFLGAALRGVEIRRDEHDGVRAVRQRDLAREEADRVAAQPLRDAHKKSPVGADRGKARHAGNLPSRREAEVGCRAARFLDVVIAEQGRARPVRPDHAVELDGQDHHRVARKEMRSHGIKHGNVYERIDSCRHLDRHYTPPLAPIAAVNGFLIIGVPVPRPSSLRISGPVSPCVVNRRRRFRCTATKILHCTKICPILKPVVRNRDHESHPSH